MQMLRGRTQGLLAMARRSLTISVGSIGVPPLLLAPGGGSRRLLHILPQGQRVWVPESFNGSSRCGLNAERFMVTSELEDVFDYFTRNNLLHPVTYDRLFSPNVSYPHFTEDDGNIFVLSCIRLIGALHDLGLSTNGLFTRENTVILPRRMLLGFKEVNSTGVFVPGGATPLSVDVRADDYYDLVTFLKDLIAESQGSLPKHLLPTFIEGITFLLDEIRTDEKIEEVMQSCPYLMSIQSKSVYYRRVYNIVHERMHLVSQHSLPAVGLVASGQLADVKSLQKRLLSSVPYTSGPLLWNDMAIDNLEVFGMFMTQSALGNNDALGLIRMLRVIASHPFGPKMVKLMREFEQIQNDVKAGNMLSQDAQKLSARACLSTLPTIPPTCREIVRLADQTYPQYPTVVATGFWKSGAYGLLDMPGLMPVL